jgi:hypothetical protein
MDDSDDEKLSPTDIEHAICLAMRREFCPRDGTLLFCWEKMERKTVGIAN